MMKPDRKATQKPTSSNSVATKPGPRTRSFSFSGIAKLSTGSTKYTVTSSEDYLDQESELTRSSSWRERGNSESEIKVKRLNFKLPKFRKSSAPMMPHGWKVEGTRAPNGCSLPPQAGDLEASVYLSNSVSFVVSGSWL